MESKRDAKPQIIAFTSDAGVWYGFEHNKKVATLDLLLGDFDGTLVADGLSIYPSLRDARERAYANMQTHRKPFELAYCWVHARRNFVKAAKSSPRAEAMLALIRKLFRIKPAYDPDAHEVWQQWVDEILKGMKTWMKEQRPIPKSQLAQAIGYMSKRWKGLTLFRDDPAIWLDNNGTERALRGPILGRKNHYGSRSERGMEAAAVFYSLIETCRLLGADPRAYLKAALRRAIETPGSSYMPADFLADQEP